MGFGEAISLYFKNYVNFKGRSRRAEYWWPALMNIIVVVVLGGGGLALGGGMGALEDGDIALPGIILFGILGLYALAIIIPSYAVFARRLHDINMSAWLIIPIVLIGMAPVVGLLGSVAQIVIGCIPGTKGVNKYGEDPKNPGLGMADEF